MNSLQGGGWWFLVSWVGDAGVLVIRHWSSAIDAMCILIAKTPGFCGVEILPAQNRRARCPTPRELNKSCTLHP